MSVALLSLSLWLSSARHRRTERGLEAAVAPTPADKARLIAAAPEMREVLLMIQALRIKGRITFMLLSDGPIMQAVDAVLAKTKGVESC